MNRLASSSLRTWIDALSRKEPTPAGGALALITLAGSAALVAKVARLSGREPVRFERMADGFLEAAESDSRTYREACRAGDAAMRDCLELGLRHLSEAVEFLESVATVFEGLSPALSADVAAAERAGRASARTLFVNLAVNVSEWSSVKDGLETVTSELRRLSVRLEEI